MNGKSFYGYVLVFLVSLFVLTGCGSDSEGGEFSLSDVEGNNTGVFIDSEVKGVQYVTSSGIEGYTNKKGEYKYNDGDEITFYLGSLNLGTAKTTSLTTVFDLPQSIEVATLLQTLDVDGNPNNGIEISKSDYEKFEDIDFELSEVDIQSSVFRKKFKNVMGYDIETDLNTIKHHATESLKNELVNRYDNQFFRYLNETILVNKVVGYDENTNTIYNYNPNNYLLSYESRLRVYFYEKFISNSIVGEIDLYDDSIKRTARIQKSVDKTAENITSNIVKITNIIGLLKGTVDDIKDLQKMKNNLPSSIAKDPLNSPLHTQSINNEFVKEVTNFGIKKFKKIGIDIGAKYITNLADKQTLFGRALNDCFVTGKPNIIDLAKCEFRLAGEAGKQFNGALGEYNKLGYLRKRNAMILVGNYIDIYYMFNKDKSIFYEIFEKMAKEEGRKLSFTFEEFQNMNYTYLQKLDEIKSHTIFEITSFDRDVLKSENILRECFDILSEKVFGNHFAHISDETVAGWQYDFKYGSKNLVEYISTVEDLTNYFTEVVDKKSIREIDTDYLDFDTLLYPTDVQDEYKVSFQLTNKTPFNLKVMAGHVTVELDGKEIKRVNFFQEQIDGKELEEAQLFTKQTYYKTDTFTIPTSQKILTNGVLTVKYEIKYVPSRLNAGEKLQKGIKYYELSKKTLLDDLSKPIINLNIPKFVKPKEKVKLDASKTVSLLSDDTFTYKWEYLSSNSSVDVGLTWSDTSSGVAYIVVPELPDDMKFYRHDFKLTVTSKTNGRISVKEFSIFVKNKKKEEEIVEDDNAETIDNQSDNSDISSNDDSTPIDTTTLTLQDCKDKTLNQSFATNTWTTSLDEWNSVHIACVKIFSDNELADSNIPNTGTNNEDTPTIDTPSNTSRTSIDYMKNHKMEKLASTDCSAYKFGETVSLVYVGGELQTPESDLKGWGDISKVVNLAPSDNMMQSITACNDVVELTELGGLSFSKAVESVVRSRTKDTSPFSDVWDSSATTRPTTTTNVDDIAQHQNDFEAYSAEIKLNTVSSCKEKYGSYTFMELSTFANIPTAKDTAVGQTMNGDASYCLTVLLQSGDIKISY